LWPALTHRNSTAFVWAGDAIYADDFHPAESFWKKPAVREATPAVLRDLYAELLEHPGYKRFTARSDDTDTPEETESHRNFTVLGAFDDHDYSTNNGDKFYQFKSESATLFMQFLQSSSASTVDFSIMDQRATDGKGVYGVKVFDFSRPEGQELLSDQEASIEPAINIDASGDNTALSDRSVAIFLIDCRSHKTPWKKGFPGKYFPEYDADFLGDEQWKWLEAALDRSTAQVNVVVQGLQVHADRYFDGNLVEDWSRFPNSQHRLYQTILQSGVSAPVLVSGDVHMAELLRKDCRQLPIGEGDPATRTLLEVTVSGMTHSWGTNICARPQLSIMCQIRWFQRDLPRVCTWRTSTRLGQMLSI
jgi:alkaline phosphatase D